jgi:hypothetical protein
VQYGQQRRAEGRCRGLLRGQMYPSIVNRLLRNDRNFCLCRPTESGSGLLNIKLYRINRLPSPFVLGRSHLVLSASSLFHQYALFRFISFIPVIFIITVSENPHSLLFTSYTPAERDSPNLSLLSSWQFLYHLASPHSFWWQE